LEKHEKIDENKKMGAEEYEIEFVYTLEVSSSPVVEGRSARNMESVAGGGW
jgi:hypothetical protein